MALDVGGQAFRSEDVTDLGPETPLLISAPSLDAGLHIGAALKAIREFKGHSLDFIAAATRVRPTHLAAIEAFDLERLPSRPFAIGYVRAYAEALGQDPEVAVQRFKAETPLPEASLRNPVGDDFRSAGKSAGVLAVAGLIVLACVIAWNVTRHILGPHAVVAETAVSEAALNEANAIAARGPILIGGPLVAPPEASTPAPYVTPGLAAATAANGSADAALAARAAAAQQPVVVAIVDQPPVGAPFAAAGQVYGVGPEAGTIVLQAAAPVGLVIRGNDGAVYFARYLSTGEAYRAPMVRGLIVEASVPRSVRVYGPTGYRGPLTTPLTPLGQ